MQISRHRHLAHLQPVSPKPLVLFTVVTRDRKPLLANPHAHEILRGVWERSAEENGWHIGDYILMPDHVHFSARASRNADTTRSWVKMWKSVSSRRITKQFNITGSLWQKDYFDRYLRSSDSYSEKWEYAEANPVRAGLVSDASDWPYRGRIHDLMF